MLEKGKVYILNDEELGIEVIWLHNNIPIVRYRRRWKITKLATRNYW